MADTHEFDRDPAAVDRRCNQSKNETSRIERTGRHVQAVEGREDTDNDYLPGPQGVT